MVRSNLLFVNLGWKLVLTVGNFEFKIGGANLPSFLVCEMNVLVQTAPMIAKLLFLSISHNSSSGQWLHP